MKHRSKKNESDDDDEPVRGSLFDDSVLVRFSFLFSLLFIDSNVLASFKLKRGL